MLLPGPPREMKPMFEAVAATALTRRAGRERFYRATIFIAGRSESHVDEAIQPIYAPLAHAVPPIETTILAAPGQIEVHMTALSDDAAAAERALASARARIVAAIGDDAFSVDGRAIEEIVGDLLREGGGHDRRRGVVQRRSAALSAHRRAREFRLRAGRRRGIQQRGEDRFCRRAGRPDRGTRRRQRAGRLAMAEGIRRRLGATIGVGVTGIAGPGGGTPLKPVGTVALAAAGPAGTVVRTVRFNGSRAQIKFYASQTALDMVRRMVARDAALHRD